MGLGDLAGLPRTCANCDRIAPPNGLGWANDTVRMWGQLGWLVHTEQTSQPESGRQPGSGRQPESGRHPEFQNGDRPPVQAAVLLAPAQRRPAAGPLATVPISADAAVLVSLRIIPELRGTGLGRRLIQASAALALRSGRRGLEAIGTRGSGSCCLLSVGWLESVGFVLTRDHPLTPRLRMDLTTALTWRADLEAAWQRLTGLVVPVPPPEGASRLSRELVSPGR